MRWRKGPDASPGEPQDDRTTEPARDEPVRAGATRDLPTLEQQDMPADRIRAGLSEAEDNSDRRDDRAERTPGTDARSRSDETTEPPPEAVSDADFEPADGAGGEPDAGSGDRDQEIPPEQVVEDEPSPAMVSSGPLYLAYAATSHVGMIRKNNQDSGYASGNLLMVADGMGGAAAGDLASAVAIESISKVDRRVEGEDMLSVLAEAISKANDKIADLVAEDHSLEGMGTTVSGVLFDGSRLGLAHIGDSRGYLLRDGEMRRLTHDHSWVQSLIDDGKISEDEAAYHPHRSLLLRVLNGQPANDPDLSIVEVKRGDRLLFCSDGLCGFVTDDVIAEYLTEPDREVALHGLLTEALEAGGLDNITIVIADVVPDEPAEVPPPLTLGAATEVEIPHVGVEPRVIDLGDNEDTPNRNAKPSAPAPRPIDSDEDDRYAPIRPPRWRWFRRLVAVCGILLVLVGLVGVGIGWARTQFYLGPHGDNVAIYQGLPDQVPLVPLSRIYRVQDIKISDLPPFFAEQVRNNAITAGSLQDIERSVAELEQAARRCVEERRTPPPTPPRTPSPTTSPSTQPTSTPTGPGQDGSC